MNKVAIPIYFDYASALCYVAWRIVRELERELDFTPLWRGVPITMRSRRQPGEPLNPVDRARVISVAAQTGIAVEPPGRLIDSRRAVEGSELARAAGCFERYHEAVFRAAFEQGADIGGVDVLGGLAERAGMDRGQFVADLGSGRMAARIEENRREANRFSAFGYPAFLLGDFPLTGIQPKETMRLLLARFLELRAKEPAI